MEKNRLFNCRVCGANEYTSRENVEGILVYECKGCSVNFSDRSAFSVPPVKFKIIGENGREPEKNKKFDAGHDLFAAHGAMIAPGQTVMIKTNIAIELPPIYEAQIRARSGLAKKFGIQIANGPGTIDFGYRNNVGILLHNSSKNDFQVNVGDRIAQIVVKSSPQVIFEEVDELSETDRGLTGFGDSGINESLK